MSAFDDRELMQRALSLAERGLFTTTPNPRVGCVIARDGRVIGEGWHERTGEAHAEVRALADAAASGESTRGATVYVTLEPCNHHGRTPPCTDALLAAGVARVVAAMRDPNTPAGSGAAKLEAAGIAVQTGLLENEARELNIGWIKRLTDRVPWVRVKIAASLDGRTALASGESQWITGEAARADGHRWRARACAILTGIGTVMQDDPRLTVRTVETPRQPLKIVIDRHGELSADARVLENGRVLVFSAEAPRVAWPSHVENIVLRGADGRVDLERMLALLAEREINELHVEGGAKLNGALLGAGLVDELLLYIAPSLLGDPARGMFERPMPLARLAERVPLDIRSIERVGEDWRVLARIHGRSGDV
ncbi:MAG TPA: bifunctional diaminohydroxyphosphoribosylaminopyrimidine deaminase/5-amino-6-(5-phosphoribosylamino)uracil reductase RibD [Casimicrobiaceae bacterium]|nr:bifunctional diaminohydroxyphosphoribosylaminopyrimidine deaminase/5-amino-6-(5-phosphoribosylamino)uracil reductase RibD [Casimicrobiaceae bacterium]